MHPLLDFFYNSLQEVNQLKIKNRFPPFTDRVQPLSFGKIGHRRYFITRKIEFGIAEYTLHFDNGKRIELSFFLYQKKFKYEHCTTPFLKKDALEQAFLQLFEYMIIDAARWNILTIEGKFRDYDFKDKDVYKAFLRTLDNEGFLFDEGMVSAVKRLSKVKTPLEQALVRLEIMGWRGVKVDKGTLPDNSYYFILSKRRKKRYIYDIITDGDHICVSADSLLDKKKLLLSLPFAVSDQPDLFQRLLEKVIFDCAHEFMGGITTLECCVTTDQVPLVKPGFRYFKATQENKENEQVFTLSF